MSKKGTDLVGQTVKEYKILKAIGEGKFSYVYRAENESKTTYAIKNIKIFDMADQHLRDKCLKQVELMKPLDHPNIIKYVDSFIEKNQLFIVSEWADKGDLKKMIKQHVADEIPFEESVVWEYMRQISSALKHMHQKKIMHRDLKPANIFISHDMTLKIGDLGLGRAVGTGTLQVFSKVGTPLYMSPQLIQGEGYNFNADVWSLGCICYQLCQLNSPFKNKQQQMSLINLFQNITKCNYKPISDRYSPQLSQVIKKMIVVDTNNRLSSEQVLEIAERNLKSIKKPLLDPFIVMDDIHIKLNLLDYVNNFCKIAERKPIHKFYFALQDPNDDQLYYFLELCYWIMALSKPDKKKEKLALYTKTMIDWSSPENACRKLLVDLSGAGIKMDEIDARTVVHGFGQTICYLLNQVLNRELIRANFQFKPPNQESGKIINNEQEQNQPQNTEEEQINRDLSSESIEEQSQFEQSIFFNKGHRKIGNEDMKLLEKIQEYGEEEDKEMIMGKIDENQWKIECLRVEKKMNDITTHAKQARKKKGYQNFETVKISSSKITDLIRSVRPIATLLSGNIENELSQIKRGEKKINESFEKSGQEYSGKNHEFRELSDRSAMLSSTLKDKLEYYQKISQKVDEINNKIAVISSESEDNKVSEIRRSIASLKKQVKELEQKQGILMWQLKSSVMRSGEEKGKIYEVDDFDYN